MGINFGIRTYFNYSARSQFLFHIYIYIKKVKKLNEFDFDFNILKIKYIKGEEELYKRYISVV